jgi:large subunit ribosomal protein L4
MAAKARNDDVIIVDRLELDAPKTKVLARVLSELGASDALVIIPERDDGLERASRNLPTVKVLRVEGVNVYDVLRYRRLVLTRDAMHLLEKRLGG